MEIGDLPRAHSAGGVVLNFRGQVAVVKQKDNTWSLPKGHLVGNESTLSAAVREIREECGITSMTFIRELGSYSRLAENSDGAPEVKEITMFLFTTSEEELSPQDPANPKALWVKPELVMSLLSNPTDKEFFSQVRHQIGTAQ